MSSNSPISEELDLLAELEHRSLQDPVLSQEWQAAAQDFPVAVDHEGVRARFLEWFLLERPSQKLGVAPILAWTPDSIPEESGWHRLLDSFMGIFHVAERVRNETQELLQLDDLWSGRSILVNPDDLETQPKADQDLLVIGRFICTASEIHVPLPGVRFISAAGLAKAVGADLALARHDNSRASLSQLECEKIFPEAPSGGHLGEEIRAQFDRLVHQLNDALQGSVWNLKKLQQHLNSVGLSETLNLLAFETELDLEVLRRLVPEYVQRVLASQQQGDPEPTNAAADEHSPSPEPAEVAAALQDFDQIRSSGQSLDASFAKLESALGLQPGASSVEELVATPEPQERVGPKDELGLEAWFKAYLWEANLDQLPTPLSSFLAHLQKRNMAQIDAIDIRQDQILGFLLESESIAELEQRFAGLKGFLSWAQTEQNADLDNLLEAWPNTLRSRMIAILQFNLAAQNSGSAWQQSSRLLRLQPLEVATENKQESAPVEGIDSDLQTFLQPDDLILGTWHRGRFQAGAVLPKEALPPSIKQTAEPE
jgi:hypothetical protein